MLASTSSQEIKQLGDRFLDRLRSILSELSAESIRGFTSLTLSPSGTTTGEFITPTRSRYVFTVEGENIRYRRVQQKMDAAQVGHAIARIGSPIPLSGNDAYSTAFLQSWFREDARRCGKGTQCGGTCIEAADECRLTIKSPQMRRNLRSLNDLSKILHRSGAAPVIVPIVGAIGVAAAGLVVGMAIGGYMGARSAAQPTPEPPPRVVREPRKRKRNYPQAVDPWDGAYKDPKAGAIVTISVKPPDPISERSPEELTQLELDLQQSQPKPKRKRKKKADSDNRQDAIWKTVQVKASGDRKAYTRRIQVSNLANPIKTILGRARAEVDKNVKEGKGTEFDVKPAIEEIAVGAAGVAPGWLAPIASTATRVAVRTWRLSYEDAAKAGVSGLMDGLKKMSKEEKQKLISDGLVELTAGSAGTLAGMKASETVDLPVKGINTSGPAAGISAGVSTSKAVEPIAKRIAQRIVKDSDMKEFHQQVVDAISQLSDRAVTSIQILDIADNGTELSGIYSSGTETYPFRLVDDGGEYRLEDAEVLYERGSDEGAIASE